jgi:site-specific recombinase XerD
MAQCALKGKGEARHHGQPMGQSLTRGLAVAGASSTQRRDFMMLRFSDAIDQFLQHLRTLARSPETIRSYREHGKQLVVYWETNHHAPLYVEDVTTDILLAYLQYLKEERQYAPASRAHVLHMFRSFYRYLLQRELVTVDMTQRIGPIKTPPKERHYLSEAEVNQLIAALPTPLLQVVTTCLFYAGLRITECLALTVDDVDVPQRVIRVHGGKGSKDRTVPMATKLYDELVAYVETGRPTVDSRLFFATARSGQLSRTHVNQQLHAAAKRLGWSQQAITAQMLRHSFASRLLAQGAGLVDVQRLLGHASAAPTSLYVHSLPGNLQEAVNR